MAWGERDQSEHCLRQDVHQRRILTKNRGRRLRAEDDDKGKKVRNENGTMVRSTWRERESEKGKRERVNGWYHQRGKTKGI